MGGFKKNPDPPIIVSGGKYWYKLTAMTQYYLYETMRVHIYLNFMTCNVFKTIKLVFILRTLGF